MVQHLLKHGKQLCCRDKLFFGTLQALAHVIKLGFEGALGDLAEDTRGISVEFGKGHTASDHFDHDAAERVNVAAFAQWLFGVGCFG